jgi:RND superfamily putative drug exporter
LVLLVAVGFTFFAGGWGTGVFGALAGGGFDQPGSESQRTAERIAEELDWHGPNIFALYSSKQLKATEPRFRDKVMKAATEAGSNVDVVEVFTYYQTRAPQLISRDRHSTIVAIRTTDVANDVDFAEIRNDLQVKGLTMQLGGPWAVSMDTKGQAADDIAKAEMISMPVLLLLLVVVFGSLVAATTPLLVGGLAILGAFTVVRVLTYVTDVSSFSINIITLLGLGLAIDYALFIVSRFREEMDGGVPVPAAVARTMLTAGRTVLVSGLTVAMALAGLLIFPQPFLRSMGLGGISAVLVAVLVSLTVLPALLAVLGRRIDAARLPWARRRSLAVPEQGLWERIARSVMQRPGRYAGITVLVLLLLGAPFLRVHFGGMDERVLPKDTESRQVSEQIRADFAVGEVDPITVLVSDASMRQVNRFAATIEDIPGVRDATVSTYRWRSAVLSVSYQGAASSLQARKVVRWIRSLPAPRGSEVLVGGQAADLVDLLDGLADRLPWMLLWLCVVTFVLLFLAFGSVVLPLKAIVMNVLSLGASFGAVVFVFQDGHLSGLLDFTPMGTVEATQPILMLALLFGLSMDYEVFLLSRVREQWDLLGDNTAAVASGVQRTGRIITAAALLLIVVVAAFGTSGVSFIKMIGVGMLVAITVDASLVRMLLVPATMRLMGEYNWWAPEFLKQVYDRFGFKETDDPVLLPQTLGSSGLPSWLRLPAGLQLGRPTRVALAGLALMAATAGGTYGLLSAAYDAAPAANFEAAPGVPQHKKHHAKPHRSPEGPMLPTPTQPGPPQGTTRPGPGDDGAYGPPGMGSHLPTIPGVPG